jgi:hypothetical protein
VSRVVNARKRLERAAMEAGGEHACGANVIDATVDLLDAAREFRAAIKEREERRAKRVSK